MVEGAWYCPQMTKNLITATIDLRAGRIDEETWHKRIEMRKGFLLRPKELPDEFGRQPLQCPAIGPNATAICPLRNPPEEPKRKLKKPKVRAVVLAAPKKKGAICTNSASVSFPIEAGAKYRQDLPFGTPEWHVAYAEPRNIIEGYNAHAKDESRQALHSKGRRRMRGRAAQHVLCAMLIFAANIRKITKWIHEAIEDDDDVFGVAKSTTPRRTNAPVPLEEKYVPAGYDHT